jgi:peptidoglycan/xylan/chitin deacetylase (PgdA/CDA1 family)
MTNLPSPSSGRLTVVMYHYVRDLARSRFPRLKALDLADFAAQLRWLRRHHTITTMAEVLNALDGETALPPDAALLTFDDGYADHYDCVFPLLDELGLQGSFYPVADAAERRSVLGANKVQLVLASADDVTQVAAAVVDWLDRNRMRYGLEPSSRYQAELARPTRFDPAETVFVKRLLQHGLPPEPRRHLLDRLFATYVGVDEATIAEELYASPAQLGTMVRHGMHVGAHSVSHPWLSQATTEEKGQEIDGSLAFLARIGADTVGWTMAYPFGDHNEEVLALLEARGCRAAFTIEPEIADLRAGRRLQLPRLDAKDVPLAS